MVQKCYAFLCMQSLVFESERESFTLQQTRAALVLEADGESVRSLSTNIIKHSFLIPLEKRERLHHLLHRFYSELTTPAKQ